MCEDCALNEDGFGGDSGGGSFLLGNVFTLDATVSARASLHFSGTFFSEEHEGGKSLATVVSSKSGWITRAKALEGMELSEFFDDCLVTTFSKFSKSCFEAVLFFGWVGFLVIE